MMFRHLIAGASIAFTCLFPVAHGADAGPEDPAALAHKAIDPKAKPPATGKPADSIFLDTTSDYQLQVTPPVNDSAVIQQVKPSPQNKPVQKPVKLPDVSTPVHVETSTPQKPRAADKIPANIGEVAPAPGLDHVAAIRDANQARMFEEARQAVDALRELANTAGGSDDVNPDLGLGGAEGIGIGGRELDDSKLPGHDVAGFETPEGAEYLPDLPSNEDQGPSSSALRPSGNLAGIMGGAASQDNVVRMEEQRMDPVTVRRDRNPDGSTTTTTITTHEDGSQDVWTETVATNDQVTYRRHIAVDSDGNVTRDAIQSWHRDGTRESRRYRGPLDPNGMQDPNSPNYSPEFARWAAQFDHSKKQGARNPNRVNPGSADAESQVIGPRLTLRDDQIVINPSPEDLGGQAREVSEEQARIMGEMLREKVAGPGGHPGDSPGQAQ